MTTIPQAENRVICGVYSFIHIPTSRRYVGSSQDVYKRKRQHIRLAMTGSNHKFHRNLRAFGVEEFDFEILKECSDRERLSFENEYIQLYKSHKDGFNELERAEGFCGPHTQRAKEKMSQIAKAQNRRPPIFHGHHSPEILSRFSKMMTGNKRAAGYRHTPEARQKISEASRGNKYGLGHKHTAETRSRISASMKLFRAKKSENTLFQNASKVED